MSDKNNIEELLKKKFENFEGDVQPDLWSGIENQINTTVSSGAGSTSGWSTLVKSTVFKWVAAVGTLSLVTAGVLVSLNNSSSVDTESKKEFTQLETASKNQSIEEQKVTEQTEINKQTKQELQNREVEKQVVEIPANESEDAAIQVQNNTAYSEKLTGNVLSKPAEENREGGANNYEHAESNSTAQAEVKQNENDPSNQVNFKVGNEVWSNIPQSSINASPLSGIAPLEVELSSFVEYEKVRWDFGDGSQPSESISATHTFETPGVYYVTMIGQRTDGTVTLEKSLIEVRSGDSKNDDALDSPVKSKLEVPNVFTPNFDGLNDVFTVKAEEINTYTLTIFNRGGAIVFESNSIENQWDGTEANGDICPEGLYFYQITAVGADEKIYAPKGFVKLIR